MEDEAEIEEKINSLKEKLRKLPIPEEFPKSEVEAEKNGNLRVDRFELHYEIKKLKKELTEYQRKTKEARYKTPINDITIQARERIVEIGYPISADRIREAFDDGVKSALLCGNETNEIYEKYLHCGEVAEGKFFAAVFTKGLKAAHLSKILGAK